MDGLFFDSLTYAGVLILWAALILFFMIIEAATVALVSIWFILGGAAAFIAALCGASFCWQIILFAAVSAAAFILLRPILVRSFCQKKTATNVDSMIGMEGIVVEEIDNLRGTGRVRANGLEWSAKSMASEKIPVEQTVAVKEVQGVTLVVDKISQ